MMKNFVRITSYFLIFIILCSACNQDGDSCQTEQQPLNPNGDSELALLMRKMHEEGMIIRQNLIEDQPFEISDYSSIMTASPTEERMKEQNFDAFALSLLGAYNSLKSASKDSVRQHYNFMVDMCVACHDISCRGPLVKIEKLYLPDPENHR